MGIEPANWLATKKVVYIIYISGYFTETILQAFCAPCNLIIP
jgi:hypothetical protein